MKSSVRETATTGNNGGSVQRVHREVLHHTETDARVITGHMVGEHRLQANRDDRNAGHSHFVLQDERGQDGPFKHERLTCEQDYRHRKITFKSTELEEVLNAHHDRLYEIEERVKWVEGKLDK